MFAFNYESRQLKRTGLLFFSKYIAAIVPHCRSLILSEYQNHFSTQEAQNHPLRLSTLMVKYISISCSILTSSVPVNSPLASDCLGEEKGRQLEGWCKCSSRALPICPAVFKHHILQVYPSLHCERTSASIKAIPTHWTTQHKVKTYLFLCFETVIKFWLQQFDLLQEITSSHKSCSKTCLDMHDPKASKAILSA